MEKSLKMTICRAISMTLQSCKSKEPAILPVDYTSGGPGFSLHKQTSQQQEFKWGKEEEWHVVTNICNKTNTRHKIDSSSDDDPPFAVPLPAAITGNKQRREKNKKKKKKRRNGGGYRSRVRLSTSSADSGWFTSDGGGEEEEERETETLISSTDSTIVRNRKSHFTHHRRNRTNIPIHRQESSDVEIPARLSVFKNFLRCAVNAKVKESFAIVKRSSDPFEDFKSSMVEMIVEKQMFDRKDLEHLLLCYLSLNSRHYHELIFEAFHEICETLLSPTCGNLDRPLNMAGGGFAD